jgi:hypothetical protein
MGQQTSLFSLFAIARAFVSTDANEYGLESSRSSLTLNRRHHSSNAVRVVEYRRKLEISNVRKGKFQCVT